MFVRASMVGLGRTAKNWLVGNWAFHA